MINEIITKNCNNTTKVIVYSVLFGNYDDIKEPVFVDENIDYILFTDNPNIKSEVWKIKVVKTRFKNSRRMSRLPKILSHKYLPEHDVSIYLDMSLQLKVKNVYHMINDCLGEHEIALYRHPVRDCIYKEINYCRRIKKVSPQMANRIIKKYARSRLPSNYGLFANGFIIRKNTENIKKLNESWWSEYIAGSERDQLSFMFCLWKLKITANAINVGKHIRESPYFNFFRHKKKV